MSLNYFLILLSSSLAILGLFWDFKTEDGRFNRSIWVAAAVLLLLGCGKAISDYRGAISDAKNAAIEAAHFKLLTQPIQSPRCNITLQFDVSDPMFDWIQSSHSAEIEERLEELEGLDSNDYSDQGFYNLSNWIIYHGNGGLENKGLDEIASYNDDYSMQLIFTAKEEKVDPFKLVANKPFVGYSEEIIQSSFLAFREVLEFDYDYLFNTYDFTSYYSFRSDCIQIESRGLGSKNTEILVDGRHLRIKDLLGGKLVFADIGCAMDWKNKIEFNKKLKLTDCEVILGLGGIEKYYIYGDMCQKFMYSDGTIALMYQIPEKLDSFHSQTRRREQLTFRRNSKGEKVAETALGGIAEVQNDAAERPFLIE